MIVLYIVGYLLGTRALACSIFTLAYGYDQLWYEEPCRDDYGHPSTRAPWAVWLFVFAEFIGLYWAIMTAIIGPAKLSGLARERVLKYYTTRSGKFKKEQGQLSLDE
jgi:hypothetical protein